MKKGKKQMTGAQRCRIEFGSLGLLASLWVASPLARRLWLNAEDCLRGEAQNRGTRPSGSTTARSDASGGAPRQRVKCNLAG